jgi:uncharacterized protein (TIGR02452 family)
MVKKAAHLGPMEKKMREDKIEIFKDTARLCKSNPTLATAIKASGAEQKIYLENEALTCEKARFGENAQIIVSKKRSFAAAGAYSGQMVAVLNFASAANPGGGVVKGASAQEESLCRCSTLYFNLNEENNWQKFYLPHRRLGDSLHNDDIIYTPGVVIFKSDASYELITPEDSWQKVNVISCAAPNLRPLPEGNYGQRAGNNAPRITPANLLALHQPRARRLLDVALANQNEVLILGAFGCGAFANSPDIVARAYKSILPEYTKAFKVIEFAIYCSPRDENNYIAFKRTLGR